MIARLALSIVLLVGTGCTAADGEPRNAARDERAPANRGSGPHLAAGELHATTAYILYGDGGLERCPVDTMRLTIRNPQEIVYEELYCSAYQGGGARLVADSRRRHFILLEHAEGRGTRATTHYLTVFRLDQNTYRSDLSTLSERARLGIVEPIGFEAFFRRDYRVETPAGGGLRVVGRSRIDGDLRPDENAPAAESFDLSIDTTAP